MSSKHLLLESYYINTSNLENNPFRVIMLNTLMKEDTRVLEHNDIKMDIECWGGRGNKNL